MEYRLTIKEDTAPVEIELIADNKLSALINKNKYSVDFSTVCDNQIHLNINGIGINAYVLEKSDGKVIMLNGKSFFVQDADLLEQSQVKKSRIDALPTKVTPPMPAVVVSVLVKEGDIVKKGKTVVVVSAMKMETSLVAPFNGVVTKINVHEGDKVMPEDILVDIKAEPNQEPDQE